MVFLFVGGCSAGRGIDEKISAYFHQVGTSSGDGAIADFQLFREHLVARANSGTKIYIQQSSLAFQAL